MNTPALNLFGVLNETNSMAQPPLSYAWPQIAGVDEVGRGAWFGPVVAAAVILSAEGMAQLAHAGVTDSKKLTARKRQILAEMIQEIAITCCIGWATVREIDRLNILQASLLAMKRAVRRLDPQPQFCWIDGNQLIPNLAIPQSALIKGDQHCLPIAAASIVAKVWRDHLMERLDGKYPGYGLARNKGYGSAEHRLQLQRLGVTALHRQSFAPIRALASCQTGIDNTNPLLKC